MPSPSTPWTPSSSNSTGYSTPSINSTGYSTPSVNSTGWAVEDLAGGYLLTQAGAIILEQDGSELLME